jgi:ATP-dependent Lon protease
VLPIGGVREKVLAAHRLHLKTVIIPAQNRKDLVDVPRRARRELDIRFVRHMDGVLDLALARTARKGMPPIAPRKVGSKPPPAKPETAPPPSS